MHSLKNQALKGCYISKGLYTPRSCWSQSIEELSKSKRLSILIFSNGACKI